MFQGLELLNIDKGSKCVLITESVTVGDEIKEVIKNCQVASLVENNLEVVTIYACCDIEDAEDVVGDLISTSQLLPEELEIYSGWAFPIDTIPVEPPINDYDVVAVVITGATEEGDVIAEFAIYDVNEICKFIENLYKKATEDSLSDAAVMTASDNGEFNIENLYLFVGKYLSLNVSLEEK